MHVLHYVSHGFHFATSLYRPPSIPSKHSERSVSIRYSPISRPMLYSRPDLTTPLDKVRPRLDWTWPNKNKSSILYPHCERWQTGTVDIYYSPATARREASTRPAGWSYWNPVIQRHTRDEQVFGSSLNLNTNVGKILQAAIWTML